MSEPAFPYSVTDRDGCETQYYGMDLRDYFAAKAMQGFLFNGDHLLIADLEGVDKVFENIPSSAYAMADAMMKARSV